MANAKRDANGVETLQAVSDADGTTQVRIQVNAVNNALKAIDAATGTDKGGDHALRDQNFVPVLIGVSSADGITPIAVYADAATGSLLIKST